MPKNILETIGTPVLLVNASKEIIKAVQQRLGVEVDGLVGAETLLAFYNFKKAHHLGEPNYLGSTTAKKLLEKRLIKPIDVIGLAVSTLGYKESPPGSNKSKYGAWYGADRQPWCASWVSWVFYHAGLPLPATTPKGFAYCPYGVHWFKEKGQFFNQPQVGDVVFFDWQKDGVSDHVGIVEKVNKDGSITTLEGNTSSSNNSNGGEVQRRHRPLNVVQGFGRPNYS